MERSFVDMNFPISRKLCAWSCLRETVCLNLRKHVTLCQNMPLCQSSTQLGLEKGRKKNLFCEHDHQLELYHKC